MGHSTQMQIPDHNHYLDPDNDHHECDHNVGTRDNDHHSFTYHYHVRGGDNYYNRTVYYHDHPGSFDYDDDGNLVHDHKHDPAYYVYDGAE